MSHAYHIAGRFLHGYGLHGKYHLPTHFVASLFTHQKPADDITAEIGRDFEVRLAPTVADALTLGTGKLAVDGVLLIIEHGDYPTNEKGQTLYPRPSCSSRSPTCFANRAEACRCFATSTCRTRSPRPGGWSSWPTS